jgi:hypothetical protein
MGGKNQANGARLTRPPTQGHNPHKPGRPAHPYPTLFRARLRWALDGVVAPGKHFHTQAVPPSLWRWWEDCRKDWESTVLVTNTDSSPPQPRATHTGDGSRPPEVQDPWKQG